MAQASIIGGWITLNRACNMRCNHCYQQDTDFDPSKNANLEIIYKEIDLLSESGAKTAILIGGEPTVYPQLLIVVKRLISKNIVPILVTNGRELAKKEKIQRLVDAGLRSVTISVKADSETGYKEVTGTKNSFEKVLQAIKNLQFFPEITMTISVTIEEYFVKHLENYTDFLKNLKVPHINFDLGSPVLKSSGVDISKIPDPFTLADVVEQVHIKLKDTDQSYSFYVTIPLCILNKQVKDELIHGKKISTSCHVSHGSGLIFSETGSVIPCNHFTDMSYGTLGKEFNDGEEFRVFWNSEDLQQFRKEFNSFPHINCSTCAEWLICGGGCKIKWMYYDPKDFIGKLRSDYHVKTSQVFPLTLQR